MTYELKKLKILMIRKKELLILWYKSFSYNEENINTKNKPF